MLLSSKYSVLKLFFVHLKTQSRRFESVLKAFWKRFESVFENLFVYDGVVWTVGRKSEISLVLCKLGL